MRYRRLRIPSALAGAQVDVGAASRSAATAATSGPYSSTGSFVRYWEEVLFATSCQDCGGTSRSKDPRREAIGDRQSGPSCSRSPIAVTCSRRDLHERPAHPCLARLTPPPRVLLPGTPGGRGERETVSKLACHRGRRKSRSMRSSTSGHTRRQLLGDAHSRPQPRMASVVQGSAGEKARHRQPGLIATSPPPARTGFRRLRSPKSSEKATP